MPAKPVPDGYPTVTPYLVMKNAAGALEWYRDALGAEEIMRMPGPDGRLMHAEFRLGTSVVMICDEFPEMATNWRSPETLGGVCAGMFVYVDDCDRVFQKAVAAGAKKDNEPVDMFWGDRYGRFTDPFGHSWAIAPHIEDVSHEEMERRQKERMAQMAACQPA